ncbi:PREDICTED: methionine--tRNA ligase, cytoplasmic-like [Rhagoletis zephyria]|uniref:methionine--tRNA ligase, cytoplasmic-like n=1 Tax=Rhagoletis zephyria TaxID=28612 RepID=UPI0008112C4F|nr:PREDICTED: methionine--tRNA ligase, cytoplasmic-like [Rhagoletis zephyria]XP_036344791.1 methionine--tRNA ligase, cytoplasmic-like isoform X2 [Rhagoletis pomonella]
MTENFILDLARDSTIKRGCCRYSTLVISEQQFQFFKRFVKVVALAYSVMMIEETGIPADIWRFYLACARPEGQDSSFSWNDLAARNNSDLLNNLGNFVNRALVFCEKNFDGVTQAMTLTKDELVLLALINREVRGYVNSLEKAKLRDGIRHLLSISRQGNGYMQAQQPWVLLKGN